MIIIPISEMSKLRLRGLGREDFSVPRLSMNHGGKCPGLWKKSSRDRMTEGDTTEPFLSAGPHSFIQHLLLLPGALLVNLVFTPKCFPPLT